MFCLFNFFRTLICFQLKRMSITADPVPHHWQQCCCASKACAASHGGGRSIPWLGWIGMEKYLPLPFLKPPDESHISGVGPKRGKELGQDSGTSHCCCPLITLSTPHDMSCSQLTRSGRASGSHCCVHHTTTHLRQLSKSVQ